MTKNGPWNSRFKVLRSFRRNIEKGGRARSQRAGPKDGADDRVEEVKVCSLVRGCQVGRRARDGDTGGPSIDM